MSDKTTITWTDATYNPWWGCQRVSPGCEHCYAETLSARYGQAVWGPAKTTPRRLFGDKHWAEPLAWDARAEREGRRLRVFCASMADVFEDNASIAGERARLFELIARTPHLDWQLLTKRPENIAAMLPSDWGEGWPNVWLGTSTEDQQRADERIPHLLATPAAVRFLSCEPLLGPIDLFGAFPVCMPRLGTNTCEFCGEPSGGACLPRSVSWVIAGGESGPGFRPMDLDWARSLRDQCQAAGVAYFYKQGSSRLPGKEPELGGRLWHEFPEARA